jgi:hypothetical protein
MRRFVLLEHRWNGIHYDFMLEVDGRLRTWSLGARISAGGVIGARALPDHRLAYLDYEGPISGDRGAVRRLDRGTYRTIAWEDGRIEVNLDGDQLKGTLCLTRDEYGGPEREGWSLRFGNRD